MRKYARPFSARLKDFLSRMEHFGLEWLKKYEVVYIQDNGYLFSDAVPEDNAVGTVSL